MRAVLQVLARNLLLLATLVLLGFLLPRILPGNPLSLSPEELSPANLQITENAFNRFSQYYAPELSLPQQLTRYLGQLLRGDWGFSFYFGLPVKMLISSKIGWTLGLSLTSLIAATAFALPLGSRLALSPRRRRSQLALLGLVAVQTVPTFLLAVLARLFLAYGTKWFPATGAYPMGMTANTPGFWAHVIRHGVLPTLVLMCSQLPPLAILTHNIVAETKRQPYVEAARYNGVSPCIVTSAYILRNSLPEIFGRLNIQFLYAIAGSLFVEMVFSYPGIGVLLKTAIAARDYPLVQGIFLTICLYSIVVNVAFQLVQQRYDPRLSR